MAGEWPRMPSTMTYTGMGNQYRQQEHEKVEEFLQMAKTPLEYSCHSCFRVANEMSDFTWLFSRDC